MKINYYHSWSNGSLTEIRGHITTECVDVIIYERNLIMDDTTELANVFYHGETVAKITNNYSVDVYCYLPAEELKILTAHIDDIVQRVKDTYIIKDILE